MLEEEESIDAIIFDVIAVVSRPKSEVRRRIKAALKNQRRKDWEEFKALAEQYVGWPVESLMVGIDAKLVELNKPDKT